MTEKRFIVDTCGTLIDMETRDSFDYVSEVVDLLNRLVNEINIYDAGNHLLKMSFDECRKENEQLKASLYAEKTNTAEVINEYAKQFKRHSSQFSFMIDLAEDLGIDVNKLGALDD